jgi:hypothetical protein
VSERPGEEGPASQVMEEPVTPPSPNRPIVPGQEISPPDRLNTFLSLEHINSVFCLPRARHNGPGRGGSINAVCSLQPAESI